MNQIIDDLKYYISNEHVSKQLSHIQSYTVQTRTPIGRLYDYVCTFYITGIRTFLFCTHEKYWYTHIDNTIEYVDMNIFPTCIRPSFGKMNIFEIIITDIIWITDILVYNDMNITTRSIHNRYTYLMRIMTQSKYMFDDIELVKYQRYQLLQIRPVRTKHVRFRQLYQILYVYNINNPDNNNNNICVYRLFVPFQYEPTPLCGPFKFCSDQLFSL